jgi:hypothetical protein
MVKMRVSMIGKKGEIDTIHIHPNDTNLGIHIYEDDNGLIIHLSGEIKENKKERFTDYRVFQVLKRKAEK